ncbi:MAG: sugar phosphate isomerase/epimerase [Ruminococcaceae bacterium]|nr:sugar phosphate isomerase/epimerase [Oscillospiraceae bacterium]
MKIAAFYENILTGAKQRGISVHDAVAEMKEAGLQRLYMSGRTFRSDEEGMLALCKEFDLQIEGLYDFFDFLHKPDDTGYIQQVDAALRAGVKNVMSNVGLFREGDEGNHEALMENAASALRRAVAYATEKGIDYSMEPFDNLASPNCTIDGMVWFQKNVPGLKCSFDSGNFVLHNEDELQAFEQMKHLICTMHVKDRGPVQHHPDDLARVCADGHCLYSTPLGQGAIQVKEIFRRLKAMGYDGGLIVEMFDYGDALKGIKESIEWIKNTWAAV